MQGHDWDDLRFLLALHRSGRLSVAGRTIGVSETTVARRLRRLERALGVELFLRNDQGRYDATDVARGIIRHAEAIERENIALRERLGQLSNGLTGVVRISSVPVIVNRILVPNLGKLRRLHPDLTVELVSEARNVDLTKREADLAVRFSRPAHGGLATKARKLGELEFAVFYAADVPRGDEESLAWIGYDEANSALPQARWVKALVSRESASTVPLQVSDVDTALEAVACGVGRSVLPRSIGLADRRLRPAAGGRAGKRLARDVWLLFHADQAARLSVVAAKTWLADLSWA